MTGKEHFAATGTITQYALPLSQYHFPFTVGKVWWVSSVSGTNATGYGNHPESPVASIAYAIGSATADNGDVIAVLPDHVEVCSAAGSVTVNKAGLRITGLPYVKGRQRGRVNYTTAAAASFDITAARVTIENLVFTMTGIDAVTAGINISAADCTISGCEIETGTASAQATLALLTTAAADRLTIEDCHIHGSTDAGTAAALRIVGGDSIRIRRCNILGSYTTNLGGIDNATTAATNLLIEGCSITNRTAVSTVCINCQAGTTGQIVNNRLSILSGTAPIVAAGIDLVGGNYYKNAVGVAAGTLI